MCVLHGHCNWSRAVYVVITRCRCLVICGLAFLQITLQTITVNGIARILLRGKNGIWGTEVPQRGPGTDPRWGLAAKPPEARDYSRKED